MISHQTFPLTDNTAYYGDFHCPDDDPLYTSSLMAVRDAYETYHLNMEGQLLASYPSYQEEGARLEHIFEKHQFCLVHLQVLYQYNIDKSL